MRWFITRWWSLSTGELQNLGNPDALRDCQPSPEAETHKTKGRVWRKGNKKTLTVGIHLFSMINFLFSSVQKISKKKWQFCARGFPFWKTSSWQSQRWYQSEVRNSSRAKFISFSGSAQLEAGGCCERERERTGERTEVEERIEKELYSAQRSRHSRWLRLFLEKLDLGLWFRPFQARNTSAARRTLISSFV